MPVSEKLRSFLDSQKVEYSQTTHPIAFSAREVATAEHLPAREVAKTVVVFGEGGYHMLVIPANQVVDFQEVRAALGFAQVRLATEPELERLFPDCELGAMPPFGNLYDLPVFLDDSLAGEPTIAFNAGTHRDVIHMRTADFRRLADPLIVPLARMAASRHAW